MKIKAVPAGNTKPQIFHNLTDDNGLWAPMVRRTRARKASPSAAQWAAWEATYAALVK